MSKAYSNDLRDRVIKNYEEGKTKKDVVDTFKIGISTLNRWIREYVKTGSVNPKVRSIFRKRKIEDEALKEYVELHPSATLEQIAGEFKVRPVSVWQRLKKLGITRKKTFLYEERDEQERKEFTKELEEKGNVSIVFVDECGIKNNLKKRIRENP